MAIALLPVIPHSIISIFFRLLFRTQVPSQYLYFWKGDKGTLERKGDGSGCPALWVFAVPASEQVQRLKETTLFSGLLQHQIYILSQKDYNRPMLFNSQSLTPCLPYSFLSDPSLSLHMVIQQLALQQQQLSEGLQSLRQMLQETLLLQKTLSQQRTGQQPLEEGENERENKKAFKKNYSCVDDTCPHRYSSRISLRAHIRKCHGHHLLKEERRAHRNS